MVEPRADNGTEDNAGPPLSSSSSSPETNISGPQNHEPNNIVSSAARTDAAGAAGKVEPHQKPTKHEPHHHHGNGVRHQVEHRATEKGALGVVQRLVEQLEKVVGSASERSLERASERAGERVLERAGERSLERASEKAGERSLARASKRAVEQAGERSLERASERAGERVLERAGERSLERAGEQAGERVLKRAGERSLERASEKAGERVLERAGERSLERASQRAVEQAGERSLERASEKAGERMLERASERALERTSEQAGERMLERAGERGMERVADAFVSQPSKSVKKRLLPWLMGQRRAQSSMEHAVEKTVVGAELRSLEAVGERAVEKTIGGRRLLLGISTERIAARIGRGLTIALPVAGGIFAFYLFRSDWQRWKLELSALSAASQGADNSDIAASASTITKRRRQIIRPPSLALILFGGAGVADLLDAVLHFFIAVGLFFVTHHHDQIVWAENLSMGCAVVSTLTAVLGEIASHRSRTKQQQQREQPQEL